MKRDRKKIKYEIIREFKSSCHLFHSTLILSYNFNDNALALLSIYGTCLLGCFQNSNDYFPCELIYCDVHTAYL